MRGKAHFKQALLEHLGITPACAGKSTVVAVVVEDNKDHPRMCGEKMESAIVPTFQPGSPPHVRGKAAESSYTTTGCRITPACAGKRDRRSNSNPSNRDHPRMCGEKEGDQKMINLDRGSPPHVRGKVVF